MMCLSQHEDECTFNTKEHSDIWQIVNGSFERKLRKTGSLDISVTRLEPVRFLFCVAALSRECIMAVNPEGGVCYWRP